MGIVYRTGLLLSVYKGIFVEVSTVYLEVVPLFLKFELCKNHILCFSSMIDQFCYLINNVKKQEFIFLCCGLSY